MSEPSDIEIVRACANAMGLEPIMCYQHDSGGDGVNNRHYCEGGCWWIRGDRNPNSGYAEYQYDPLHDDAQAMALVEKFQLSLGYNRGWGCVKNNEHNMLIAGCYHFNDLNRAICLCVHAMQREK